MLHFNQPFRRRQMIPKKEGVVTTQYAGKEYSGHYHVDGDLLIVSCNYGTEKAILTPDSNPELLTGIMLSNIIKKTIER